MMRVFNLLIWVAGILSLIIPSRAFSEPPTSLVEDRRGMIGIQLAEKEGQFYVFKVFNNSPAEKAGLKDGDTLLKIEGKELTGLTLPHVVKMFDGTPDSEVDVTVLRSGSEVSGLKISRISPNDLEEQSTDFSNVVKSKTGVIGDQAGTGPTPSAEEAIPPDERRVRSWLQYFEKAYGFKAALLDPKFGEKMGAIFSEGVLVLDVKVGQPSFKAGLVKWDLIYRIQGINPGEYFRTREAPPENSPPFPLEITLMGITGERKMRM